MSFLDFLKKSKARKKLKKLIEAIDDEDIRYRGREAFEVLYEEFLAHPDTKRKLRKKRAGRRGVRARRKRKENKRRHEPSIDDIV